MKTLVTNLKLARWITTLALAFITIGTLVTMQISYAQELATAMVHRRTLKLLGTRHRQRPRPPLRRRPPPFGGS